MIEIGPRLRHRNAPHGLADPDQNYAQCNDQRRMECRLPIRKEVRRCKRLDESHGMCLAVLVPIRKQERGYPCDWRIVCSRRVEFEKVEDGKDGQESKGAPKPAIEVDEQDSHDEAEDQGHAETKGAHGDAGE